MTREREGDLVQVASAGNEAEAELIQGFLQAEGVPSVLRRTAGFDVPEFLAAGPRDVLVAADRAALAREALEAIAPESAPPDGDPPSASRRVLAGVLIAVAVVAGAVCVGVVLWI
jgi:Putative prokaryotic signal transducing protein